MFHLQSDVGVEKESVCFVLGKDDIAISIELITCMNILRLENVLTRN